MTPAPDVAPAIGPAHRRRLRALWRSAGWPFQDGIEIDLLAAGLLVRQCDAAGRETLRVTDAGIAQLAETLQGNRAVRNSHEALVAQVAREMQRAGRLVWRGLSLRGWVAEPVAGTAPAGTAPAGTTPTGTTPTGTTPATDVGLADAGPAASAPAAAGRWTVAMPDVYSIRHTSRADRVAPVAHEIKVQRADLLADLRRPAKGEAYRWLSSECWYVIREGIAQPQEIPEVYGVMLAQPGGALAVARPAPRRAFELPFGVWMALARATPERLDDDAQQALGHGDAEPGGDGTPG